MADMTDFIMKYHDHGQGLPVLLIHGYPLNHKIWEPQILSLSDQFHIIAPDLRGFGKTPAVPGQYSVDLYAEDCLHLLDALHIQTPVVVGGLSMGGYIAFAFLRKYPERVAGLLLTSTRAGADSDEAKTNRLRSILTARDQGVQPVVEGMLPKLLSPHTPATHPALVEEVKQIMLSSSVEGITGALTGMMERPDSTPMLPTIKVPTLVAHGLDDTLIPSSEAQAMQSAIPGAKLALFGQAGHLPTLEQPEQFNQIMREFLAGMA